MGAKSSTTHWHAVKRKSDELQRTNDLLSLAAERGDISVWEWDVTGGSARQVVHSKRNAHLPDVLDGFPRCLFELQRFHVESEHDARLLFDRVESGESKVRAVLRVYDPSLREYWWEEISFAVELNDEGAPVRAVGSGRDITDCMETARKAEREKQRYEALFKNMAGGVAIYRISQDSFGVIYFSDGVAALAGYTRAEYEVLVREGAAGSAHPDDAAKVSRELHVAAETGDGVDFEFRQIRKDGPLSGSICREGPSARRAAPRSSSVYSPISIA